MWAYIFVFGHYFYLTFLLIVFCLGVALSRPTLAPVWKDRVLRAHRFTNCPHTYYIQPKLLFRHSFGLEPSAAVLSLIQTNKKSKGFYCFLCLSYVVFVFLFIFLMFFAGVATMKINKSKLKDMVGKGVPEVPISVKRKRTDDGLSSAPRATSDPPSKKATPVQASPSLPSPPPIIQIPDEEITFVQVTDEGSTVCQNLGVAVERAEAVITDLDFQEYATARTKDVSRLMVHSLMRVSKMIILLMKFCGICAYICFIYCLFVRFQSLNEAMVVNRRCHTTEDDLNHLKQQLVESEASEQRMRRAVFELTTEKRDLLATVDLVKADLTAREGDAKAAIDEIGRAHV